MDSEGGKKRENEKILRVNLFPFPHSLPLSSYSLHFLASRMQRSNGLRNPGFDIVEWFSFKLWDYKILKRKKGGKENNIYFRTLS